MLNSPLKVGIFLDSNDPPEWVCRIIREIEDYSFASVSLILTPKNSVPETLVNARFKNILYRLYSKVEEQRLSVNGKTLHMIMQPGELSTTYKLHEFNTEDPSHYILDKVRNAELDVLINLSNSDLNDVFSGLSRLGVWQLCYGISEKGYRKKPDGFWENYYRSPIMDCMLVRQQPVGENIEILYQASFATEENRSALFNRIQAYLHSAEIIPRKLRELYELGDETFHTDLSKVKRLENNQLHAAEIPKPNNLQMFFFFLERVKKSIANRFLRQVCYMQWTLRYRFGQGISMDFNDYNELIPTGDGWWADPFLVYENDTYHLFFEDALLDKNNANISVISIQKDGTITEPRPCLVRPYHLSYPFVFEWEGDYYMMPESKGNNTVEVYKATRFPDQWEFHTNLMENIEAVDNTLYFHDGKWWMFNSIRKQKGVSIDNELSIFYADSPLSTNWTPHPLNPVITDVRRARPAGRIYEYEGKIIRPSQDGSVRYGYGLRLNEIVTLTETDYQEREVEYIEPLWDKKALGTHTIAHEHELTVIDVFEWRPRMFQRI